jgi:oxygen-independent coproporphyrinogen-3 oxidase
LYIGGGSPISLGSRLCELVQCFARQLSFNGPVAIEVYPEDVDARGIECIEGCRTSMASLGVQSFDDNVLQRIQRRHSSLAAKKALETLSGRKLNSLNVDLLFAIEGQSWASVENDLKCAMDLGATQITCYPLFMFPFTEIGQYRRLRKVKLPPSGIRKDIYYRIHEWCQKQGFQRTSVWSFTKPENIPFSSVTRDHFAGFGPSAGSFNGSQFYFNTFSIEAYAEKLAQGALPVALKMGVPSSVERLFWTYWKFYQTEFDTTQYEKKFGRNFRKDFKIPLMLFDLLKWIEPDTETRVRLSTRGSHWLHLLQNLVALDYTSRLWEKMKLCAWPSKISL